MRHPPPPSPQAYSREGREGYEAAFPPTPPTPGPSPRLGGSWHLGPQQGHGGGWEGKQEAGCPYLMDWPGALWPGRLQNWLFLLWMPLRTPPGLISPLWSLHTEDPISDGCRLVLSPLGPTTGQREHPDLSHPIAGAEVTHPRHKLALRTPATCPLHLLTPRQAPGCGLQLQASIGLPCLKPHSGHCWEMMGE